MLTFFLVNVLVLCVLFSLRFSHFSGINCSSLCVCFYLASCTHIVLVNCSIFMCVCVVFFLVSGAHIFLVIGLVLCVIILIYCAFVVLHSLDLFDLFSVLYVI